MKSLKKNASMRLPYLLLLTSFLISVFAQAQNGVLVKKPNVIINANCHGYLQFLPDDYSNTSQRYPLFIFINGQGAHGSGSDADLERHFTGGGYPHEQQRAGSFPQSFTVNGQTHKFIFVTPQFITHFDTRLPTPQEINDVINFSIQTYRVDTTKIYLVGNSSGGGPIWDYPGYSSAYANRIAAIIPFSGVSYPDAVKANRIKNAPVAVWAFHNEFDNGVPVAFTKQYVSMINDGPAPPIPAKITIFPDGGHISWFHPLMRNYPSSGLNIYQWLLQYSRSFSKANAGEDKETMVPANPVQLNGSGTGPNGTTSNINWTKLSGPAQFSISNGNTLNPTVSNLAEGAYVFRITITDNSSGTATDDVTVTVNPTRYRIEAENWTTMSGVQTEATTDAGGGLNVAYIDNGDWMDYVVNVPSTGNYPVRFRVSAQSYGLFQVKIGSTVLRTIEAYTTRGWQTFITVYDTIPLQAGQQTIRIESVSSTGWNFNWWEFTSTTAPPPPPPPPANYINIPSKIEAENYTAMNGVQTESTTDAGGGQNVGYIDNGDWMDYNINATSAGTYTLSLRVASQSTGGQFQVRKSDGSVLATVAVPNTGGWQSWQTVSTSFTLAAGNQTLRVTSISSSGWNFNWMDFTLGTPPPPPSNYISIPSKIEAENYVTMSGVIPESTSDAGGGQNLGYIGNGDWMDYNVNATIAGSYTLSLRLAANGTGGQLQVRKSDGSVLATVAVPNTGGWQSWQTVSTSFILAAGDQTLRVISTSNAGWNFNWMDFTTGTPPPPSNYTNIPSKIEAENYTSMSGVVAENTSDAGGGQNLGYIDNGDWMDYNVNATTAGSYTLNLRVAANGTGGQLQIRKSDGSVLATVAVPNTGGWQSWQTVSTIFTLAAGDQTLRVISTSTSGWNINWLDFTTGTPPPPSNYTNIPAKIEAENYITMSGVVAENTTDAGGGQNLGYIDNGDWMDYNVNATTAGNYTLNLRLAANASGGQLQIRKSDGSILATVSVPNTAGWQNWQTISTSFTLAAGNQTLRLISTAASGWNINWLDFTTGTPGSAFYTEVENQKMSSSVSDISFYPNPVQDRFVLKINNPYTGNIKVEVVSINGAVVKSFVLNKTSNGIYQNYLSLSGIPKGQYIIKVQMKEWREASQLTKQ